MKPKKHNTMTNLRTLAGLSIIAIIMVACFSCNKITKSPEDSAEEMIAPPPPPPPPPPPNAPAYTVEKGDTVWIEVDAMPEFPGGESEILNFIAKNTSYPASAKEKGIQGRVIVSFVVGTDGKAGSATIVESVDPDIDAEALRVVNSLPAFNEPAFKNGKAVPVWFMVPISFKLQ